jgi:hypothetical protein
MCVHASAFGFRFCWPTLCSILLAKVVATKSAVDAYSGNIRLESGGGCHKSGLVFALNQSYFLKST